LNITHFGKPQLCNSLYIPIVYQIGNHFDEGANIEMSMKNKKFALASTIVVDTLLLFFFHLKWCISSSHILSNLCYIEDCPPNILANSFIVPSNLLFWMKLILSCGYKFKKFNICVNSMLFIKA
jgi:hypothetical protein